MKLRNTLVLAASTSLLMGAALPSAYADIKTLKTTAVAQSAQEQQITIMVKRESNTSDYPWEFVRVPSGDLQATIRELSQDPDVIEFELDRKIELPRAPKDSPEAVSAMSLATPSALDFYYNDPEFINQRIFKNNDGYTMRLIEALERSSGGRTVRVGVLDSGFTPSSDTIYTNGYSFSYPEGPAFMNGDGGICSGVPSPTLHGTEVAAVMAATPDNQYGIAGVAPKTEIVAGRIADCGGSGYFSDMASAILWMSGLDSGRNVAPIEPVEVINLSFSGFGTCPSYFQSAVNQALNAGVTVVVSAGNDSANADDMTPGDCENVINVAATKHTGELADFSNSGTVVDIAATGSGVVSLTENDDWTYTYGTSFSAPIVAGIVALVKSNVKNVAPAQLEQALAVSGNPAKTSGMGVGGGIIDAMKFMDEAGIPRGETTLEYAVEGKRERYQDALLHPNTTSYLRNYTNGGDACSLVEVSGVDLGGDKNGHPLSVFGVLDGYPQDPSGATAIIAAQSSGDHVIVDADQWLGDPARDYGIARCDVNTGADCSQKTTIRAIPKAALSKPEVCKTVATAL